jgi:phenylacetate-CoA ligase
MFFFHLKTAPGCPWPRLPDASAAQLWSAYLELERTQWLGAAEIQERQLESVRALLTHCVNHVPYYRQLLPAAGIVPGAIQSMDDFRRIPVLSRQTYQQKLNAFVAERLPPGTVFSGVRNTSGSSGTPTKVLQTSIVNLWWSAFCLRDLEWCNIDPRGTVAGIRSSGKSGKELAQIMEGVTQSCWLDSCDRLIESGFSYIMDIRQDHARQLQWLRALNPDYLVSYPANLEVLASRVRLEGPLPRLRVIQAISDTLTDETRSVIEAAFGVPVKNTYTCTEMGYLASPCPEGHGSHVHAENVLLEVLDQAGQPCRPGETGKVLLTHLHNLAGPLVRYDVGDQATVGTEPCPCGRGLPLLARIQGKDSPMFHLAGGRLKSTAALTQLVRKVGGHWQHQVVQKALDHVVVRVVIDPSWTPKHATQIEANVREFFEGPIRVDMEIHDRLPLPPSGKFQNMVVELAAS